MEKCNKKGEPLCSCVDWKSGDAGEIFDHLLRHYEFQTLDLNYRTLSAGEIIRVCELGICQVCGGSICIGTQIEAGSDRAQTISEILDLAEKRWQLHTGHSAAGERFGRVFMELFHEEDRDNAFRAWNLWIRG